MALDIIGDIHGCASKLKGLLRQLGFRERDGAYGHPERQAVFVGDLIDRGPEQLETLQIVRSMVDAGMAQVTMGNHEFNAIAYATPDPRTRGEFMRSRAGTKGAKHRAQHAEFLEEVGEDSKLHREWVEWFKALPLWLELGELRVVHACWDHVSIDALTGVVDDEGTPKDHEFWIEANTEGTEIYGAVDTILKGPEIELGKSRIFVDKDGHFRSAARIRWWDSCATTLRDIAEIPPNSETPDHRPFPPLPEVRSEEGGRYRYDGPEPVFYGHYWRTGLPVIDSPKTVCVDYSAVKDGPLVAYRWDGESLARGDKFIWFNGQ